MTHQFTIKTEDGIKAVDKFLETNSYLSGGNAPGAQDRDLLNEIETAKFQPCHTKCANLYGWWWTLAPFRENARALWGADHKKTEKPAADKKEAKGAEKKEEKKEDKKAEDDLDLFGDDPAAEEEAAKQAAKRKEEAASKKKKEKAPVICKSEVIFDVKGYETSDDFDAIAAKIKKEINQDGLVWKDTHRIVPIGFGMNKLEMGMIIVDDLVSTDDIFEKIQEWEEIQSVDIVKFNKA